MLGLLALAACEGTTTEQGVLVNVTNKSIVTGIVQLSVYLSNQGKSDMLWLPATRPTTPLKLPSAFSISVPPSRSGYVDIAVDGVDLSGVAVASGDASVLLQASTFVTTSVDLHAGASSCGNRRGDLGETCDDGNRFSGDGCSFLCQNERAVDASFGSDVPTADARLPGLDAAALDIGADSIDTSAAADVPLGAGGMGGSSGATGGSIGSGGIGTGGANGRGGAPGTGGATSVTCTPACSPDEDCIGTSCVLRWGGMTCTTQPDCPAWATCCDGSRQTCDGTRLPSGDGTNAGQFVVAGDGLTVTDTITGLVWQRDGSGTRTGCSGPDNLTCEWAEAKAYCASLTLGGITGWRLPAMMELSTIVDFTKADPAIDPMAFPNTPADYFWTSSALADYLWTSSPSEVGGAFHFWTGGLNFIDVDGINKGLCRVRCVR
jgi:cysteine-rich repeat protein